MRLVALRLCSRYRRCVAWTMLSVVIPSFNHGLYLRASLASVLAQLRAADEIIVIDDASTDDSLAVASSFLHRHPNFRLLQNSRNLGCVRTLNKGLALAQGSIIYFGAADDLTYPMLFARAAALLESYPQAGLFSGRSDLISYSRKQCHGSQVPRAK